MAVDCVVTERSEAAHSEDGRTKADLWISRFGANNYELLVELLEGPSQGLTISLKRSVDIVEVLKFVEHCNSDPTYDFQQIRLHKFFG